MRHRMKPPLRALLTLMLGLSLTTSAHAAPAVELARDLWLLYPEGWTTSDEVLENGALLYSALPGDERLAQPPQMARLLVTTEERESYEDAAIRVSRIATNDRYARPEFSLVAGWPVVVRRYQAPVSGPQVLEDEDGVPIVAERVSVAMAMGPLIVRFEGVYDVGASTRLGDQIVDMMSTLRVPVEGDPDEAMKMIGLMQMGWPLRTTGLRNTPGYELPTDPTPAVDLPDTEEPDKAVLVSQNLGELELDVSKNGQTVLLAGQGRLFTSTDSGATISNTTTVASVMPWTLNGDPSVAVGATDTFYAAYIGQPAGQAAANGVNGCATEVIRSTNGINFNFVNHARVCPAAGTKFFTPLPGPFSDFRLYCFPDQHHIATDRKNLSGGNDQLYAVWRNFDWLAPKGTGCGTIGGSPTPMITCSQDGGATWKSPRIVGSGDRAHVAVATDGFVYVTYRDGGDLLVDKFSSCASGFKHQAGFPTTVITGFDDVNCPLPGVDRCTDGLSSGTLSIDDVSPSHVTVAYAHATTSTNEDVVVHDSYDGGLSWDDGYRVNGGSKTRRYLPWVCSTNGVQYVGMYRRNVATANSNDLTNYFVSVAGDNTYRTNVTGPHFNMSKNADPQCATWPAPGAATRNQNDSESCLPAGTPQLAGVCSGANKACDFTSGGCAPGQSCQTGTGAPKYGDYNGLACRNGRFYAAWASATAPPGVAAPSGIQLFLSSFKPPLLSVDVSVKILDNGPPNEPVSVPTWFNLTLDGNLRAWHSKHLGPAVVSTGKHTIDVGASPNYPCGFSVAFGGDCDANGSVTLAEGDNKSCTIKVTFSYKQAAKAQCKVDRQLCMDSVGKPGGPLAKDCAQEYGTCSC